MVANQAAGMAVPFVALCNLAEDCEEKMAVVVIFEDVRPCVTTRGNVMTAPDPRGLCCQRSPRKIDVTRCGNRAIIQSDVNDVRTKGETSWHKNQH